MTVSGLPSQRLLEAAPHRAPFKGSASKPAAPLVEVPASHTEHSSGQQPQRRGKGRPTCRTQASERTWGPARWPGPRAPGDRQDGRAATQSFLRSESAGQLRRSEVGCFRLRSTRPHRPGGVPEGREQRRISQEPRLRPSIAPGAWGSVRTSHRKVAGGGRAAAPSKGAPARLSGLPALEQCPRPTALR